jgi:hypothetical protein
LSLPAPINWLLNSAEIKRLELENKMLKQAMASAVSGTEQGLENILGDVEEMRQAAEGQLEAYRQGIRLIIESVETLISAAANGFEGFLDFSHFGMQQIIHFQHLRYF